MKLNHFISIEINRIVKNDCSQFIDKEENKGLLERFDELSPEPFETLAELKEYYEKLDDCLAKSKRYHFIIDQLEKIENDDFSLANCDLIKKKIRKEQHNRLYPLIWAYQQNKLFEKEEFFYSEIVAFLEELLHKYGYLIELDDFFSRIELFSGLLEFNSSDQDKELLISLSVILQATKAYPNKLIFKVFLAKLYFIKGDYEKALSLAISSKEFVETKYKNIFDIALDGFNCLDYLSLNHFIAMIYSKSGDYDKVIAYEDFVISNNNAYHKNIFGIEEDEILSYTDSYFYRMRANMMKDNIEMVKDDYEIVKVLFEEPNEINIEFKHAYKAEYADVFKFIEDNISKH